MNEEDILFLEESGYIVNEIGAITTKDGTYVSEFANEERSVKSLVSLDDYNHFNDGEKEVEATGFEYDDTSIYSESDQKAQVVAKNKIGSYVTDPSYANLLELPEGGVDDPNYKVAFGEIMEGRKNSGQDYYDSIEAFQEGVTSNKTEEIEQSEVLSEFDNEVDRDDYVKVKERLTQISKEDVDIKTAGTHYREQDDFTFSPLTGGAISNPGEEANIIEKGIYNISKFWTGAAANLMGGIAGDGTGMDNKELKKEYKELKDREVELLTPIATKKKEETDLLIKQIGEKASEYGIWSDEYAMYARMSQQLGKESMKLNDYINGNDFDWSVFSTKSIMDLSSMGFVDVHEQLTIDLDISKKLENDVELTDVEKEYLYTQEHLQKIQNSGFEQSFWHEATGGTVDSVGFLVGGWQGRIAGKAVSRGITTALPKMATPLVKTLAVSGNLAAQTTLHSGTYNSALDKYVGDVEIVEGVDGEPVFLARHDLYNSLKEENRLKLGEIEIAIEKYSEDTARVAELKKMKESIIKYDASIEMPFSGGKSLLYGGAETLKEVASEQFGSAILGKMVAVPGRAAKFMGNKTGVKWQNTKLGKRLVDTKLSARFKDLKSNSNTLNDLNRATTTVPGTQLIGSQAGEMFEEVLVQVMPTVGSDWDGYVDQLSELTKADFYMKIAAQTFLMRSGSKVVDKSAQRYNMYKGLSSEDKAEVKRARADLQVTFDEIAKRGGTQEEFNRAFMSIGEGKFSITDYNNSIKGLEEEGNFEEVASQEEQKRAFAHKQIQSVQAKGKLKEFKKSLQKAKYNKNLDPETKAHIESLLVEVNDIQGDDATYVNSTQVIDLRSKKKFTDKTTEKIEAAILNKKVDEGEALEEINKHLNTEGKSVDEIFKGDLKYSLGNIGKMSKNAQEYLELSQQKYALTENSNKLQKELDRITDFKHQNNLMNEQDYKAYLSKVGTEVFKGKLTSTQFKKYIAEKPRKVDVRRLGKEKLDKINNDIIVSMTKNEAMQRELSQIKKAMSKQDTKQEPVEVVETNAPVEQVNTNVEAPLASTEKERLEHTLAVQDNLFGALEGTAELVSNLPEQQSQALERESTTVERENTLTAEEQKNISEINEGLNFNEELDLSPTGDLVNEKLTQNMKGYFDSKTQWEGVSPTFKDFWVEAISEGMIKKNDLNKAHMQVLAANWEAAGNGDSKWESIWKENYVKPNSFLSNIFEENDTEIKTEQVVEKEVRDNSDASVEKAEVKIGINPSTGEVQNATPVHGKTAVTQVKANFKAIEYENQRGEVVEIDGKPMVLVSKEDVNKDKIPTLNESKTLNVKATLRTNPGDTWSAEVVGENNWDITVEVVNPNTWKSSFMPFSEWVKQNQKGRTLEEFKQSEEYLNKVPMLYRDKAGEAVAFVADADWHNALTVKDTSKKEGEYVDLNNPSVAHLTTIKEAKDNTIALRKEIANGSVSSVVVESRNGSPWTFIPSSEPSISLEKMSPTSEIVFFKSGTFYGLNNERLDKKVNILNPEIAKELNKKGKSAGTNSAYYLSPVSTENGVTSYEAIPVLRKNENNEAQAFTEDVETAKYILGAQRVLKYADANIKELGITKVEAEALQATIKSKTGLNIKDYDSAKEIVHSLITLQVGNKKYTVGAKNVPVRQHDGKKWVVTETSFSNALFKGQAKALQNTNLDHRTAKGVIVKKNSEGAFEVEVTETYQDFLRKRLSTTVMSYNIGTEGKPQHTHSVQPIITLNSIAGVVAPVSPQVQEKTEPEVEIAKQSLTEQENVDVENAKQILRELNALNEGPIGEAFLGDLENIENTAEALKLVSTFNSKQQRELEQYMFSIITSNHEQAIGLNNLEFKNLIVKEYLNHFNTKKSALQSNYNNIKQIVDSGKEVEGVEALLKNLVDTLENIDNILENSDEIYSKKLTEANRRGFIETNIKSSRELDRKLDEEIEQAEQNGYVDNFFKGSNETVHKDKIGNRLKRIFSEIGTGESGFMGVELFENYDKMYNQTATFLSNPLPLAPSFDAMIEKMETVEKSLPWMASLVKNLKDAPEDVKDGFASNMYKYAANAKFVAFTKGTTGLEGEVWFSNANNLKQKIKDSWVNNFKRGDTTTGDLLNKEAFGSLANQYDSWGENPWNQSDEVLRDWLSGFGIVLTDGSWQELKDGNLTITNVNRADEVLSFEDLFYDEGKRKDRLFSNLANYAKQKTKLKTDLNYSENPLLLPFEDMGSILKGLIEIESHYNASLSNITRRDGGKTVSEIVFPSYFLDTYNKLVKSAKGDKTYLKELQNTAFAENSYWLDLLVNEPAMAEVFNFGETGLMSMRNIEGEVNPFAKVEDLSPLDYIYHQRAMFQDMKTEKFPKYKGWKM
ncbi:MAG: hypothetical protein KAU20_00745, partial [Nanoarchaeota archaeon]|nr:hypothetical protein [Nanoarchaeota archaeon]